MNIKPKQSKGQFSEIDEHFVACDLNLKKKSQENLTCSYLGRW